MRIGLNLLHALPEIGGGWNYIARLVSALGKYDRKNTYICFVTDKSAGLVADRSNFQKVLVGINPVSRLQRVLYENTILQIVARKYRLDLMHWFANTIALANYVPAVTTMHDLLVFEDAKDFSRQQRFYLRTMIPYAVRNAAMLLPVSQSTAHNLCQVLGANRGRMAVIPAIVDSSFKPAGDNKIADFRCKYNLPDHFWIYVAHFYPHKNHLRLIQAYHQLKSAGIVPWRLILRGDDHGTEEKIRRTIAEFHLEKEINFLPRLDKTELPMLYSAAAALVFPSLYEGGGIPVLEAMACGCPVIASDIPSIREFGGDAVLFFDPSSLDSIINAMTEFQESTQKRIELGRLGLTRVEEHRPENVVRRLVSAYQNAVNGR